MLTDPQTERALLSACLWEYEALALAADVSPSDFSSKSHERIFAAIRRAVVKGEAIDKMIVRADLMAHGHESEAVEMFGLEGGTTASTPWYAKRILTLAKSRRFNSAMRAAVSDLESDGSLQDVTAKVQAAMIDACAERDAHSASIADIAPKVLKDAIDRRDRKDHTLGYSTGLAALDAKIDGLQAPDLVILAARPAMGKSALAGQMALSVAEQGAHVMIFSLEMGDESIVQRMLSQKSGVGLHAIRKGHINDDMEHDLCTTTGILSDLPITIDDRPALTASQIQMAVQRQALKGPLGLVVVDYLQLLSGETKGGNREQDIAGVSRAMKAIAKRHCCCVLALSQLNRGVEARADKRPLMSDLRESGAIEQDADVILFVYREAVYSKRPEDDGLAEIGIAKHRAGESGRGVQCAWDGPRVRFMDSMGVR
jgi:replicative DNA helicase